MNAELLINLIIRQTMVLISQIATSRGVRAQLANLANDTFVALSQELAAQGVGQKVIADMFGLALRSYQQKLQRLNECQTHAGHSIWEAVYQHLKSVTNASQVELLTAFRNDDGATVRGVLRDMVDSGLVYQSGRGLNSRYRIVSDSEMQTNDTSEAAIDGVVWLSIYRHGPISVASLSEKLAMDENDIQIAIERLQAEHKILFNKDGRYYCDSYFLKSSEGWEAALFDHYQTMVHAIGHKLQNGQTQSLPGDKLGGSTYIFEIWDGHAMTERIEGLLAHYREELGQLWTDIQAYNQQSHSQRPGRRKVSFYLGQDIMELDDES